MQESVELNLNKRVLKLNFNNAVHTLNFPTTKQFINYEKKRAVLDPVEQIDLVLEFITDCGLARDVAEQLEPVHLNAIINELSGIKKK